MGHARLGEVAYLERLTLEAFHVRPVAWLTILNKRPAFRAAFADFDAEIVAAYDDADRARLMADAGIVRNRLKVDAAITNARATVSLRDDGGLPAFVESFRPEVPPAPETTEQMVATSPESVALSKALKKRGFAFVGPTTMYALMEAIGIRSTTTSSGATDAGARAAISAAPGISRGPTRFTRFQDRLRACVSFSDVAP